MTEKLLSPFALNQTIELNNRIIMAPMTRCMADNNLVPTQAMVDYYARRADAGLIITEATLVRADGQGYPNIPGLFTPEQIDGWRQVTDAVHNNGGKIFAQIWHTGRLSHPYFYQGDDVLAPSTVKIDGSVPRMRELEYLTPTPMTQPQIAQMVDDFAQSAANAIDAGFDGVEIHGANGYLLDQFLHYESNTRDDEFGQTPENMARFPLQVVDAVISRIGADRTALRLSPGAYLNMQGQQNDKAVFDYLLNELTGRELAFLHVGAFDASMEFDYLGGTSSDYIRQNYANTLIGVGGLTAETGNAAIENNQFDLLAIGRPFIANPDYVKRVKTGSDLVEYSDEMLATLV
jgi:2,4-dienoyl-CoA reductase-like NADH-dependent reductase (Old Yellow Enzyme family)